MGLKNSSIAAASLALFAAGWANAFELTDTEWKSRCPQVVTAEELFAKRIDFRPIEAPHVRYPQSLMESEQSGLVQLLARIDTSGLVADIQLVTATDPAFADSALAAVRKWRYAPQTVDGKPTCVEAKVEVSFRVE